MIDTKEYNEILFIIHNLINNNEIKITDESFSISFLKHLLINHPLLQKEILSLKEKSKIDSKFDHNIFKVVSNIVNKKNRSSKVLLNNIDDIVTFHTSRPSSSSSVPQVSPQQVKVVRARYAHSPVHRADIAEA